MKSQARTTLGYWASKPSGPRMLLASRTADFWGACGVGWRAWLACGALGIIWGVPIFLHQACGSGTVALRGGLGTCLARDADPAADRLASRCAAFALPAHKPAVVAFALAEFVVPFSAISIGERWIDSSVTGILIATVPLTIALISRFFLACMSHSAATRLSGLLLGLVGVAALVGLGTISGVNGWTGVGCMLLATLGYAIGPLIVQRHLTGVDSFGPVAASLLVSSIVLLPFAM